MYFIFVSYPTAPLSLKTTNVVLSGLSGAQVAKQGDHVALRNTCVVCLAELYIIREFRLCFN